MLALPKSLMKYWLIIEQVFNDFWTNFFLVIAEKSNFRMALRLSINDVEAIILNILKLLFIPIALEKSLNALAQILLIRN